MRNGQNKRMRGRNRKNHNPLTRVYESNGPDVKIRGTASHIADKYMQLARDAQASGDPVGAENYFQHAEHYFRLIAAAQEQFRQNQPFYRPEGVGAADTREDTFEEGEEEVAGHSGAEQPAFGTRDPQPYLPRDAQFYPSREPQQHGGRQQQGAPRGEEGGNVDRLPSFITGSGPHQGHAPNGHEHQGGDRFPLHRRRRRHRGPRSEMPGPGGNVSAESGDDSSPQGSHQSGD